MPLSKSDVNECLALAVAAFPNFPLSVPTIDAYYELLSDIKCDKADLYNAVKEVIKTSSFFPTVAGICEVLNRKPTYQPKQFDALEFTNEKSVPMPERLKALMNDSFAIPTTGGEGE